MKRSTARGLCLLLLMAVAALAHGEGDGPRSRARMLEKKKEAAAAQLKQAREQHVLKSVGPMSIASQPEAPQQPRQPADKCKRTESEWEKWRDENIEKLLTLGQLTDSSGNPDPAEFPSEGPEKYLVLNNVAKRSTDMANELDFCAKEGHLPPVAIMGNFTKFVTANRNADFNANLKHQFGHQPEDREYLRRIERQVTLPCLLKHPTFLELISSPSSYHQAWKLIEQQNTGGVTEVLGCPTTGQTWMPLIYRSKFLSTPDNAETFGRFFVFVPGLDNKDYDRWIQFGAWLPEDEDQRPADYGGPISNVSIVSIAKSEDPGAEKRFDALADWWRVAKDGEFGLELRFRRETPPYESDNCIRCHKVLPVGIHPAAVYEFDQDGKLVLSASARQLDRLKPDPLPKDQKTAPSPIDVVAALQHHIFTNYRRAPVYETDSNDSIASPVNYGPPLGLDIERGPDSVRSCAAPHRLDEKSLERVSQSMGCAHCHNGRPSEPSDKPGIRKMNFGMLNFPLATEKRTRLFSNGASPNLVHAHISAGVMPPDNRTPRVNLTEPERDALFDCLSQEYFIPATDKRVKGQGAKGQFVNWLKNADPATAAASKAAASSSVQKDMEGTTPASAGTRRK